MLWKLEQPVFDPRSGRPAPPPAVREPVPPDEGFPTPGDVFGEMAETIAAFLAIALVMHLLVDLAGVASPV